MSNVNPLFSPVRDLWSRVTGASESPSPSKPALPSSASSSRADADIAYDSAVERMPVPALDLKAVVARMDPVGAKLDQLKAAASGPYTVDGATVYSGAQFRMNGGHNEASMRAGSDTLARVAARVGLSSELHDLQTGRGGARSLVKLTQALIDDGQLPNGSLAPLADRIHDLQWRFGIGLDCAGYVHQAVSSVCGDPAKLGLRDPAMENFTGLPRNAHFTRVLATAAGAGDVMVLAGTGEKDDPGHNVLVRSRAPMSETLENLADRWVGAAVFLRGAGLGPLKSSVHVFEVDSSFGAGATGDPHGGVRRDVLLYDSESKLWCTCRDTNPPRMTISDVPYGEHALTGIFRAKVKS